MAVAHPDGRWKKWTVSALLFLGLLACLALLIKLIPELQLRLHLSVQACSLLILFYSLAIGLSALLWRDLVRTCTDVMVAWSQTMVGIAALMLGKYLPGKVAGLTGRVLTISPKTGVIRAGFVTALEQGYMLAGLVVFSAVASLALPNVTATMWVFLVPLIGAVISLAPRIAMLCLQGSLARKKFAPELRALLHKLDPLTSLRFLVVAVIIAAAVCAPAWILPDILSLQVSLGERFILMAAYSISIVAGMMAIILPGGIGAREAAFVFITQSVLTLEVAIAAAALLRLINVVADLTIGILGFSIWKMNYERV